MSRRGNAAFRCSACRLHGCLCLCDRVPQLAARTRLLLVIHRFEARKTTNTGLLAARCLAGSEVHVRGEREQPSQTPRIAPDSQPILLFPHEDAVPIERYAGGAQPITLIVPDGNWRQASRVRSRVPGMAGVPAVYLPAGPASRYKLRAESRAEGMATLEAIARALGILESRELQRELEELFEVLVERTRWSRGELPTEQLQTELPPGAQRHDPRHPLLR
jgi:DTW domain-containing protein